MQITINGVEVVAKEEEFDIVEDNWNEYRLRDGGKVRVRTIVERIYRVIDQEGRPVLNQDGSPFMIVSSSQRVVAS